MDIEEPERLRLAEQLRTVRLRRFKGNKKAAYTAAGVNSGTWERAERGEPMREHTRIGIVSALWPETNGDLTRIPEGGDIDLTTWDDLKNPRYDAKRMAERIDELEQSVADLTQRLEQYEPTDDRTDEERDADLRDSDDVVSRLVKEAKALGIPVSVYGDEYDFDYDTATAALSPGRRQRSLPINVAVEPDAPAAVDPLPIAARRGRRSRSITDRAQNAAGEESQDESGSNGD